MLWLESRSTVEYVRSIWRASRVAFEAQKVFGTFVTGTGPMFAPSSVEISSLETILE